MRKYKQDGRIFFERGHLKKNKLFLLMVSQGISIKQSILRLTLEQIHTKSKDRRCGDRYETINHNNGIEVSPDVVENDNCVVNIIQ